VVDDATIASGDLQAVIDPVWYSANTESLASWNNSLEKFSVPQRQVFAMLWADADICNGGFSQFFWNSGMMMLPEAVEGFEAIGRKDLAEILDTAAACFPHARDREIGALAMNEMPVALKELTHRYWDAEGDFDANLLAYIRSQPEAFYFDGEIYAAPPLPVEK
jgi:hypothetical protein